MSSSQDGQKTACVLRGALFQRRPQSQSLSSAQLAGVPVGTVPVIVSTTPKGVSLRTAHSPIRRDDGFTIPVLQILLHLFPDLFLQVLTAHPDVSTKRCENDRYKHRNGISQDIRNTPPRKTRGSPPSQVGSLSIEWLPAGRTRPSVIR